ncbi:MAG: glycosyltransferase family 4 protein [Chloroflexi bacterium]|nr:glycosyltransferase family 4 protein [Chloroflexota bacterium]
MKILHICRQYYPSVGGVERFVADLALRLAACGHTVEIGTLNRLWHERGTLAAHEMVNGLPVHRLPFVGGPLFFAAPGVLGLARHFDVIHIHNTDFFLDFLAAAHFLHRRPLVVSTHGGFFHTADHAALKRLHFNLITARSLRKAIVIPSSASDERKFATHAGRAVRIDNAIDYTAFASVKHRPVPGRVITVGRLAPNKNLPVLLQMFARARELQPNLSLVVVGDGYLRAELEQQAAELNIASAARWTGEIDDAGLRAELGAAETFLSAASYEGFGLALLEAMAAGLIPVVNDIEAFRDVVINGQNGFLADYRDAVSAARTLVQASSLPPDQKQQLSAAAKATAAKFDWPTAMEKFEAVYKEAINKSS